MEAIEEKHETILASIVQDHNGDMQNSLTPCFVLWKKKYIWLVWKAKELVIEAVEKHFESKTELARELTSFYCEVKCYKKVLSIFFIGSIKLLDVPKYQIVWTTSQASRDATSNSLEQFRLVDSKFKLFAPLLYWILGLK